MQINLVSIGIILFNLSTTISFRKILFHIFLALELHLLFLIDFDCQTLHTVLATGISLIKQDIEVYVNKNVLDNLSRQWQKFDQLRDYKPLGRDCLDSRHLCLPVGQLGFPNIHGYTWIFKQKHLQIFQILLHITYKKLNWLHITGTL